MSIIKKISNGESIIWVWKIEESIDELIEITNQTTDIKNEIKRKEFYASRILIEKICEELDINFIGIKKDDRQFMVIFHPSYLLRFSKDDINNPYALTLKDLQKVRKKLYSIN